MHRPYHHSTSLTDVKQTYLMFLWLEEQFGTGIGNQSSTFDPDVCDFSGNHWCFALSPILKSESFQVRLDLWFVNLDDAILFKLMYGD